MLLLRDKVLLVELMGCDTFLSRGGWGGVQDQDDVTLGPEDLDDPEGRFCSDERLLGPDLPDAFPPVVTLEMPEEPAGRVVVDPPDPGPVAGPLGALVELGGHVASKTGTRVPVCPYWPLASRYALTATLRSSYASRSTALQNASRS